MRKASNGIHGVVDDSNRKVAPSNRKVTASHLLGLKRVDEARHAVVHSDRLPLVHGGLCRVRAVVPANKVHGGAVPQHKGGVV